MRTDLRPHDQLRETTGRLQSTEEQLGHAALSELDQQLVATDPGFARCPHV